jgi:hypothetical protein
MQQLFLSRRNLLTLLSKLDRKRAGEDTKCTLVKRDTKHPEYPSTDEISITALEDEVYYTDRKPGAVNPLDVPKTSC